MSSPPGWGPHIAAFKRCVISRNNAEEKRFDQNQSVQSNRFYSDLIGQKMLCHSKPRHPANYLYVLALVFKHETDDLFIGLLHSAPCELSDSLYSLLYSTLNDTVSSVELITLIVH